MNAVDFPGPAFAPSMDELSPHAELVARLALRMAFPERRKDRYARARINALIAHVASDVQTLAQALQAAQQTATQMLAKEVSYAWSGTKPCAMDAEEELRTDLVEARARLRLTEEQVLRQARVVEQLKADGRDTSEAEELLRSLEDGLRVANDLLWAREDLLRTNEAQERRLAQVGASN